MENEMPAKIAGAFAQAYREENQELRAENERLRAALEWLLHPARLTRASEVLTATGKWVPFADYIKTALEESSS